MDSFTPFFFFLRNNPQVISQWPAYGLFPLEPWLVFNLNGKLDLANNLSVAQFAKTSLQLKTVLTLIHNARNIFPVEICFKIIFMYIFSFMVMQNIFVLLL